MTNDKFIKMVKEVFEQKLRLLERKGKIYGSDDDRLRQFRLMSAITGMEEQQTAIILASKHFTALCGIISKREYVDFELIDEITGDIINYMLLIRAIYQESYLDPNNMLE